MGTRKSVGAVALGALFVASACGGTGASPSTTPVGGSASASGAAASFGAPETSKVAVAIRLPNFESQAPIWLATNLGYYQAEGLTVSVINTQDTVAAVVSGSVQLGMETPAVVSTAFNKGVALGLVSGWFCTNGATIAVQPSITTPSQLAGQDVILGGTPGSPDVDFRLKLLKESGWDLSGIDIKPVSLPGGSDAWAKAFVAGKVALTYFFARQRPEIVAAGGKVIVDEPNLPGYDGVLYGQRSWIEKDPNTLTRFLYATMRGLAYYQDVANKASVLALMKQDGFKIAQSEIDTYVAGIGNFTGCAGLPLKPDLMTTQLTNDRVSPQPSFAAWTATGPLVAAQKAAGYPTTP